MQVISLRAHAVEVARVSLRQEVCSRSKHGENLLYARRTPALTAHAGNPANTDAVPEDAGQDPVILGSSEKTAGRLASRPTRAIDMLSIFKRKSNDSEKEEKAEGKIGDISKNK